MDEQQKDNQNSTSDASTARFASPGIKIVRRSNSITNPSNGSTRRSTSTRSRSGRRLPVTLIFTLTLTLGIALLLNALRFVPTTHARDEAVRDTLGQQMGNRLENRQKPMVVANLQTTYVGESSVTQSLKDNQAQPLTLTSADYDEDGMPDLVAGYATRKGGGIVTIQRGNVHALFPDGEAVRDAEPPAFLPVVQVFALPEAPDFLGAGDFDADGHWDVVAAKRGSNALFFMQGDQRGGLHTAERTELSGRVTALTTGEINRRDGLTDIVVGTDGPEGTKALVFESPEGAIRATWEFFDLPAAASSFALGQFAGDYQVDLAIAAANNLVIVRGRDRRLTLKELVEPAVISSRQMPFSITEVVTGKFSGDFEGELALRSNDGQVYLLTPPMAAAASDEAATAAVATVATAGGGTGERIYTPVPTMESISAVVKDSLGSLSSSGSDSTAADDVRKSVPQTGGSIGEWQLKEVAASNPPDTSAARGSLLVRARVSGAASDELLVLDAGKNKIRVLGTDIDKRASRDRVEDGITVSLKAQDEPVAVLPMRLNRDGLNDLVILKKNSTAPAISVSAPVATFTVNTTADVNNDFRCDATYCSLRGAISAANASPGADLIAFNIPGPGVKTINTVVGFSLITDPVTIDGYTQPGSSPNTLVNGDNAVLLIEINGATAQQGSTPFSVFNGNNNVFRGLAIGGYRFVQGTDVQAGGFGIAFHGSSGGSDNNFVEGCFVGTNAAGTVANPNNNGGIFVFTFSDNNTFGGTTPAARNLLSGNGRDARAELNVSSSAGCTVCTTGNKAQGNFVGTDITGTISLEDTGAGIFFFAAHNSLIGGTAPGARNIISGKQTGISFQANGNPTHQMPGALVQGNFLGLDVNGKILRNDTGMAFGAVFDTTFGGTTPAAANTSSGNTTGIFFANNATNNLIQGNFIGTDVNGANKGNTFHGVFLSASRQNVIGGAVPGAGNVIAFTVGNGIRTVADTNSNRNTFRGNSIHSNTMLGIDLAGNGVTPNDAAACDADTGANELQNFPVLTDVPGGTVFVTATATNSTGNTSEFSQCVRAQLSGGNVSIQGTLDSRASSTFTLDFYSNSSCDSSGNGEGQTFLGSTTVTSSAACSAPVNVSLPVPATFQFNQSTFAVSESAGFVNVNVTRSGDTSTTVTVDYTTSDNSGVIPDEAQAVALCGTVNGVALSKCDFNTALGTLRFAAGETTKSFTVLLTQDSYVEGTERAPLTLSKPTNGAVLGNQSSAMLEITDDTTEPSNNAIDDPRNFVRQHYHDFLNREPDQAGWDFWTDNIAKCNDPARRPAGQTVEQCLDKQRETTSGAFFLSPEFQYTGSYIYGVYKGSLGRRPTFLEFMRDLPQLVNGIIVGGAISGQAIEANRAQYVAEFVQRTEFASIYGALSNQGYVDKLFQTTGTPVSNADKQTLVNGLNGGTETRASVLHKVVNGTRVISEGQIEIIAVYGKAFYDTQFNPAFVQMEYFGYMRRNEDQAGFDFWLGKLNFYGNFISAEMVRSFLLSPEYRRRFGSQ